MTYSVLWSLVGDGEKPIDAGRFDEEYDTEYEAERAIRARLSDFPISGHDIEQDCWWAKPGMLSAPQIRLWVDG